MFSANENIMLRQHKRRIVDKVESTMPEEILDLGTTVMVMQVSCRDPGCVPLETAIIIIFPGGDGSSEILPGLPESKPGGSYKTKILKPMSDVTDDDILDALPPAFQGGRRTMERLCIAARDVMISHITQLFGPNEDDPASPGARIAAAARGKSNEDDEALQDRMAMAKYLQQCLQEYMDRKCQPPKWGGPFEELKNGKSSLNGGKETTGTVQAPSTSVNAGNFTVKRPVDENMDKLAENLGTETATSTSGQAIATIRSRRRHQAAVSRALLSSNAGVPSSDSTAGSDISRLFNREHAPGIRQPGCPCCDPDSPANVADMMSMI